MAVELKIMIDGGVVDGSQKRVSWELRAIPRVERGARIPKKQNKQG